MAYEGQRWPGDIAEFCAHAYTVSSPQILVAKHPEIAGQSQNFSPIP